ncbi:hypothetical protein BV154_009300 [Haemophilus influenzae]|uniref:hypothetical protein n=1 Tax=Haemophilus influenzae TaxID=727 RepID=UPI000CFFA980|nr:hypothetical protein [Haemophilus influenzae]AWP53504.1 hypothetical protein DLJ98_01295 [Haemophilus influenzae]PRI37843.1 hypothetical protein BVZ56_00395 [Haemophilus influenzae]PRI84650.1 hypothetical protein BV020_00130 [Haemophilus influenzae]PRI90453.1 hypothetical protein BV021_01740 [Haemophilus influenzae]PRJ54698.1 hypothetical protein BV094_00158 [Haemophilus influenzae]
MKKLIALFALLPFVSHAAILPNAAIAEFDEFERVEDVSLMHRELTVHTTHESLSKQLGKYYAFGACEIAGLSDEWRDVQFNRIRVENLSGNQGVKWQISREECKKIMVGDYSDVQIEKGYLGRERFRQF